MYSITIASWVTLSRIALTPIVVYFFVQGAWELGLLFFTIAMLTDLCDGFVARRFGQESRLGQILDPIADKILLSSVMFTLLLTMQLSFLARMCVWFLIAKESVLLCGGGMLLLTKYVFIAPSRLSRFVSLCEALLVVVLVGNKILMVSDVALHAVLIVNVSVSILLLLMYGMFLAKSLFLK